MSDLVPPEQPTGEVTPLRPKQAEPQNRPANSNRAPPWQPGQSGNSAGRPRGSRNRLSESFLCDFHTVWEEEGLEAIRRCARNDPSTFVRVAASLLPHAAHRATIRLSSPAESASTRACAWPEYRSANVGSGSKCEELNVKRSSIC
jgi:hypothetical protein